MRLIIAIGTLSLVLLAASLTADAAQPPARKYRIGVILAAPPTAVVPHVEALRGRLRDLGYIEQQNLVLELTWGPGADGGPDRVATDLVRSKVDLLIAWTTPAVLAAKRATSTIPIVMVSVGDPVGSGLVTAWQARHPPRSLFTSERHRIAELAQQTRLATVFQRGENVDAGGLMSYGPKLTEQFRQAANYVDQIFRGAKPADLPVEEPGALDLEIPPSILGRADHVIQ